MDLSRARALVTGGSSGIGRATAKLFVDRGARVVICGRDESRLREAAAQTGATPIRADVSDESDVAHLVAATVKSLGGYDVLINNAGFGRFAPLLETSVEDMRHVWETNVLGAFLVARESARHFVANGGGNIVNVASTSARKPSAGGSAYASSKFALAGLSEVWRAELRKHDVRVMQINPSEVQTEFHVRARRPPRAPNDTKLRPDDIARAIAAMLEIDDRALLVEATLWASNPQD